MVLIIELFYNKISNKKWKNIKINGFIYFKGGGKNYDQD